MSDSGTTVIVGGSAGIGIAVAHRLLRKGRRVNVVARPGKRIEAAVVELGEAYGSDLVRGIPIDLGAGDALDKLMSSLRAEARIRGLVNAAGYFFPKPFLEHTGDDFDRYHAFNRAFFFITQAIAKRMQAEGGGAIVNVGSMWARQAIKATPSSAYSMAKAGLHAFTQHAAMELADSGIRVNAVSPAVVETYASEVGRLVGIVGFGTDCPY